MAEHEFIVNVGSSTSIWLLGSDKKWINLRGLSKYKYKYHRDNRKRAKKWNLWPQNILLESLGNLISNYDNIVNSNKDIIDTMQYYKDIFNLDTTNKVMEIIHRNM